MLSSRPVAVKAGRSFTVSCDAHSTEQGLYKSPACSRCSRCSRPFAHLISQESGSTRQRNGRYSTTVGEQLLRNRVRSTQSILVVNNRVAQIRPKWLKSPANQIISWTQMQLLDLQRYKYPFGPSKPPYFLKYCDISNTSPPSRSGP